MTYLHMLWDLGDWNKVVETAWSLANSPYIGVVLKRRVPRDCI